MRRLEAVEKRPLSLSLVVYLGLGLDFGLEGRGGEVGSDLFKAIIKEIKLKYN